MKTGVFRYSIQTMGCKANIYDSLLLERELMELGGERIGNADKQAADVFVLNSCTVTEEADKQAHRAVQKAVKTNPGAMTIVTGCYAEVSPDAVAANAAVHHVIPNHAKQHLKRLVWEKLGLSEKFDFPASPSGFQPDGEVYWGQLPSFAGKTRAFLKIQEGCNDFCTYCIIPYARGKSRSVPIQSILEETRRLAGNGIQEAVLTGTNIADWGKDSGACLEDLIEAMLVRTDMPRLRLTSLDPGEITPRLLELMRSNARLMPHFHVSLQSPVSRVLRAMKRDYRTEDVGAALERIHALNSNIFVGMDVIAGFPSETDAEHQEAVDVLKRLPWARLHVFPYSERQGTPALKIKGAVPHHVRKERAKELIALSDARHRAFAEKFVGRTLEGVLMETAHQDESGKTWLVGHAPNYLRVLAAAPTGAGDGAAKLNTTHHVRIEQAVNKPQRDWMLMGRISSDTGPL